MPRNIRCVLWFFLDISMLEYFFKRSEYICGSLKGQVILQQFLVIAFSLYYIPSI